MLARSLIPAAGISMSFNLPLLTSLVPTSAKGSGTPTFTRATAAYVADHEGILRQALSGEARFTGARRVRNMIPTSSTAFTSGGSVTVTTGQTDPAGGTAAVKVVSAGTGIGNYIKSNVATVPIGNTATLSIWLKGDAGGESVTFNSGNGIASTKTLTTSWVRYSVRGAVSGSTNVPVYAYAESGTPTWYAAFAQTEDSTGQTNVNPGEYVSVGVLSAPYHGVGVDGVKYFSTENGNTVASNVVTEATGAAISTSTMLGYLAEGARTNICLQSNEFDEAVWVSTNVTVDDQTVAAPDGTTTADTLTAAAADATLIQDLGVIASAVKTFSIYLKRKTGTGAISLTLDGGSTWTAKTITTSWARYDITQTLADPDCGIKITTSGDEVYAWGAQVEAADTTSTVIPTTTAATTRNADLLTYVFASNVNNAVGTAYAEYLANSVGTGLNRFIVAVGTNGRHLYQTTTTVDKMKAYDGTTVVESTAGGSSLTAQRKIASSWGANGLRISYAGTAVVSGSFDGEMTPDGTTLQIGNVTAGTSAAFGNIRNVKIYTVQLTDAQLVSLTT